MVKKIGFAVLIILLFAGISSAKQTEVLVGDWKITFNTSDTIYITTQNHPPDESDNVGYYIIWINKTPYISSDLATIFLYYSSLPSPPVNRIEEIGRSLYTGIGVTPTMSMYIIDGESGYVCQAQSDAYGKTVYGAIAPSKTARLIGFLSLLDKDISYEIINSLHVEQSDKWTYTQPFKTDPAVKAASGTRENPIPMGTIVDLGDGWEVTVLSVVPNADNAVLQENQFNNPPKSGGQFFLAKVRATYKGSGSSTFRGSYRLRAVGPSSIGYSTFENNVGVIPDPLPDSEVFSGGSIEGYVGWEIRSGDADALVMYDSPLTFGETSRLYMALYGGQVSSISFSSSKVWAEKGHWKMGRY